MKACELCPRRCRVDRVNRFGFCKAGENLRVALVSLHEWEEPCLVGERGAGTIFFSHCNLRCVFCQNFSISHEGFGAEIQSSGLRKFLSHNRSAARQISNSSRQRTTLIKFARRLILQKVAGLACR
ncbi:MAG: hypothetical protein IKG61_06750 [Selenomonadaceae bacterium]|nr:hypothetical protein [Selenomonadaceae bacterium]